MIADLLSRLADWLPLGYAFGAGMVATINPCGLLNVTGNHDLQQEPALFGID